MPARLLEQAGAKGHIFHLSSADGLAALERWRARGLDLTTEVTAHHCFLGRDDYGRLAGQLKVNPPVRGEPHSSALLRALADGRIDCVASDHAPHMPGEKLSDMADASAGIAGVETTLPLFINAVSDGRLTLERLADATSAAPARVWSLAGKGRLAQGADADLTLVDVRRGAHDPGGGAPRQALRHAIRRDGREGLAGCDNRQRSGRDAGRKAGG